MISTKVGGEDKRTALENVVLVTSSDSTISGSSSSVATPMVALDLTVDLRF